MNFLKVLQEEKEKAKKVFEQNSSTGNFYLDKGYLETLVSEFTIENPAVESIMRIYDIMVEDFEKNVNFDVGSIAEFRDKYIHPQEDLTSVAILTGTPIMLWGEVGAGKTFSVYANQQYLKFLTGENPINLTENDPMERFIGLQVIDEVEMDGEKHMATKETLASFTLDIMSKKSAFVFFDELTRTHIDVQNRLTGFLANGVIQDRAIYKMLDKQGNVKGYRPIRFVATSNYFSDSADLIEPSTALLSRMMHLQIDKAGGLSTYSKRQSLFGNVMSELKDSPIPFNAYLPVYATQTSQEILKKYRAIYEILDKMLLTVLESGDFKIPTANKEWEDYRLRQEARDTDFDDKAPLIGGFANSSARFLPRVALVFATLDSIPSNIMSEKRKEILKQMTLESAFGRKLTSSLLSVANIIEAEKYKKEILTNPIGAGKKFYEDSKQNANKNFLNYLTAVNLIAKEYQRGILSEREMVKLKDFFIIPVLAKQKATWEQIKVSLKNYGNQEIQWKIESAIQFELENNLNDVKEKLKSVELDYLLKDFDINTVIEEVSAGRKNRANMKM